MDDRTARLSDVDPRLLVIQEKESLDAADIGTMPLDESLEIRDDIDELEREGFPRSRLDHPIVEDLESPRLLAEEGESDRGRPRIYPQNY